MLRYRILSAAVILAALFSAAYMLPAAGIGLLVMTLGILGLIEYDRLLRRAGIPVFRAVMLAGGAALTAAAFIDQSGGGAFAWETGVLILCLTAVLLHALLREPGPATLSAAACTILGILYLPFTLNFFMRLALLGGAGARTLALFPIVVVKVSDMGAYFGGRFFGKHKLCPRISPGKTREGLAGGIAAGVIAALVFAFAAQAPEAWPEYWRPLPLAAVAVVLTLFGVAGDLVESLLKRAAAVKDSSGALPGMGGILDVLDSLLLCAPVFYLIVRLTAARAFVCQ